MFWKRFLWALVVGVVVVGLLVAGGYAAYSAGWSHGNAASQLAAPEEGGAVTPYAPFGFARPGARYGFAHPGALYGFAPFAFILGALFRVGLLVLLIALIGRLLFFRHWRMAGYPPQGPWTRHGHPHHGPMPPWCEEPSDKSKVAEPPADGGPAGAAKD